MAKSAKSFSTVIVLAVTVYLLKVQLASSLDVTVDIQAPSAPVGQSIAKSQIIGGITDPSLGGDVMVASNSNVLTLTGTAETNSTIKIFDGAVQIGTAVTDNWGSWSYTTDPLAAGTHSFLETATDAAGNTSQPSSVLNVSVNAMVTITSDTNYYHGSSWIYNVYPDPWKKGSLINGVDYTSKITLNPATFPNGVNFSWSWPLESPIAGWNVRAYPHVQVYAPDGSGGWMSTQVANFIDLSTNYSVTLAGKTGGFNVSFDLWLTDKPNGAILDEIMVWVHSPRINTMNGNQPFTITDSSISNASVRVSPGFIGIKTPTDLLSDKLSLSDIFKTLIWNGVLTGQEYISQVQFGAEVQQGTGGFQINNFSNSWNAKESLVGTPGNDSFVIGSVGGNHVIGGGGIDTVIYSGLYSNFQIKQSASGALVMQGGNISTLDVLQGVQYIKFSDGTYNVTNSVFTPSVPSTRLPQTAQ
jgi:hypothetical protein